MEAAFPQHNILNNITTFNANNSNVMSRTDFFVFTKNTDATSTNKGFYFQYLVTLKLWLQNRNNIHHEIYCETEDDILQLNAATLQRNYTQVKCYSTGFSLKSKPLLKSLLNFYKLFLKDSLRFDSIYTFYTNSTYNSKNGNLLGKWYENQNKGQYDIEEFLLPLQEALIQYVSKEKDDFIKSSTNQEKVGNAIHMVDSFIRGIMSDNFKIFLGRIRWEFYNSSDKSIQNEIQQIISILEITEYNKNINIEIVISYLLHQVIKASSQEDVANRLLNSSLLMKLIKKTENENIIVKEIEQNFTRVIDAFLDVDKRTIEIKENTEKVLNILIDQKKRVEINPLHNFEQVIRNWFIAIDYKLGNLNKLENDFFYFSIEVPERRKDLLVLIYGMLRPIHVPLIEVVESLKTNLGCDEAWIVSTSYPSPAAIKRTANNTIGDVLCFNFDELLEQTIDFGRYFDWIEKEVIERKINERYIPLAAKKGEFDISKKEIRASSIYAENEGWLEGYIDMWVLDKQKEHISVLGEFGTGKTWFTLHYAWQQILKYNDAKQKKLPRPRIPILIPLRDFSKALQVDVLISDFFFRRHKIEIKGAFSAFMELNKMGKLLLIFDGFDEMAEKVDKQKMIDNFWELASVIKGHSKVILTCRNEHFSNINEGRNLLNSEYNTTTRQMPEVSPQFEVIELLKFNRDQIKKLLSYVTTKKTIDLIFRYDNLIDLISRPIMIELILDSLEEIEAGKTVNISSIYFYAARRKMERDILQNRTFTSLVDKLFFMCELAWEMLANDKLAINYKEFPDIIYKYFNHKVEAKDLDYWRYDMRSQSLLIIDDEGGSYKPAHKSLLEFFVAYKFAYELGILKDEYMLDANGNSFEENLPKAATEALLKAFGLFDWNSSKMEVVFEFLVLLIRRDDTLLWNIYEAVRNNGGGSEILINNIIYLLSSIDADFSNRKLNNLSINGIIFDSLNFENSDLTNSKIIEGAIRNCNLSHTNLENIELIYNGRYPSLTDISGLNCIDFIPQLGAFISVARFGFNITENYKKGVPNTFFHEKKGLFVRDLAVINNGTLLCVISENRFIIYEIEGFNQIYSEPIYGAFLKGISKSRNGMRFATFTDGSEANGNLKIWNSANISAPEEVNFENSGLFDVCFSKNENLVLAAGRDGDIFYIDTKTKGVTKIIHGSEILNSISQIYSYAEQGSSRYIYSLSLDRDENILAIGSTVHGVILWNFSNNCISSFINTGKDYVLQVGFSPDNRFLAYQSTGGFYIVSVGDWKIKYSSKQYFQNFKFSPDGKYLVGGIAHDDSTIDLIDLETFQLVKKISFNLDFSKVNITGMKAPGWIINYYIKRGAKGWYSKDELLSMGADDYGKLLKRLEYDSSKGFFDKSRDNQVRIILKDVNKK